MKASCILVLVPLLLVFLPGDSFPLVLGPYTGKVIDSQTGEPVEGASVFFYAEKTTPVPIRGGISEPIEAKLLYTDKKGSYLIPKINANLGPLAVYESTLIIIYQPGYQRYAVNILNDIPHTITDPSFKARDNVIKLDRIPPNFDHREHYRTLEDRLSHIREYDWQDPIWRKPFTWEERVKLNLKSGVLEKEELLRRAEWERRRGQLR